MLKYKCDITPMSLTKVLEYMWENAGASFDFDNIWNVIGLPLFIISK